jgi:hypothetical protein
MLVASHTKLDEPALALAEEPGNSYDPWMLTWPALKQKATNFLRRPWNEKVQALRHRLRVSV